jgi:GAF domain-containing protein
LSEGLGRRTDFPDLLRDTVRAVVQLADCERGFLLLRDAQGWQVRATHGLEPGDLRTREFRGSVGAVERAMQSRLPVVLNDVGADPVLSARASVVASGLQSLVVFPLLHGGEVIALVYADTRRPKAAISQTDMELLEAFGERAALWIAAKSATASLDRLAANAPAWQDIANAAAP